VVATTSGTPASALLTQLVGAQHVADVPVLGGAPFAVYRQSGAVPAVAGEVAISSAIYRPTSSDALRLDAAALDSSGMLRLRWTVLAAPPAGVVPEVYHIQARAGVAAASALGSVDCQATRWEVGETVFTWLPLGSSGSRASTIAVTLSASAPTYDTPQIGPLHLLSARSIDDTPALVPPTGVAAAPGSSGVASDGSYDLVLASLV
jgi:hypothetical protein